MSSSRMFGISFYGVLGCRTQSIGDGIPSSSSASHLGNGEVEPLHGTWLRGDEDVWARTATAWTACCADVQGARMWEPSITALDMSS